MRDVGQGIHSEDHGDIGGERGKSLSIVSVEILCTPARTDLYSSLVSTKFTLRFKLGNMEMLATLPYSYDSYTPIRSPRKVKPSPAQANVPVFKLHSRNVSRSGGVDEAFWELEEQQKQDRLINIILALLHI